MSPPIDSSLVSVSHVPANRWLEFSPRTGRMHGYNPCSHRMPIKSPCLGGFSCSLRAPKRYPRQWAPAHTVTSCNIGGILVPEGYQYPLVGTGIVPVVSPCMHGKL